MDTQTLATLAENNLKASPGANQSTREKHLQIFKENGFNVADREFYKFTNLASFIKDLPTTEKIEAELDLAKYQDIPTVFVIDGKLSSVDLNIHGLSVKLWDQKSTLPEMRINPLTHLHHSVLNEGIVITLEKNINIETPLRILYVSTKSAVNAATLVFNAGVNSSATVIEEHLALSPGGIIITESYFQLEKDSRIEQIQIGDGKETLQHASTYSYVNQNATFRNFIFHLGGKLNRRNLDLKLASPGAHGESYGLYLTQDKEHSDISTVIDHLSADSTSRQLAKGILDGESKGIFTGKIHIHPQAQRVVSGQLNKNLLLSKKAQAHSQPQLEIFADDVKCSHGSTTGQLSNEELFYFQSRGIPADKARSILAHGFGMEVVLKISNKKACQLVSHLISEKLNRQFNLGNS